MMRKVRWMIQLKNAKKWREIVQMRNRMVELARVMPVTHMIPVQHAVQHAPSDAVLNAKIREELVWKLNAENGVKKLKNAKIDDEPPFLFSHKHLF